MPARNIDPAFQSVSREVRSATHAQRPRQHQVPDRQVVSVFAQTGLSFDLNTASGKLMRTITAGLAEFDRDLIRDRVKSDLAAARARGVKLDRQVGQRPSDKKANARHAC